MCRSGRGSSSLLNSLRLWSRQAEATSGLAAASLPSYIKALARAALPAPVMGGDVAKKAFVCSAASFKKG